MLAAACAPVNRFRCITCRELLNRLYESPIHAKVVTREATLAVGADALAPLSDAVDVDAALRTAARAFEVWRDVTPAERSLARPGPCPPASHGRRYRGALSGSSGTGRPAIPARIPATRQESPDSLYPRGVAHAAAEGSPAGLARQAAKCAAG
jgi:hypothetical protein